MRVPDARDPRLTARMWVPEQDRARWRDIVGPPQEAVGEEDREAEGRLAFTGEDLDTRCRYGERTHVFDDARRYRATTAAAALHTWDEVPRHLYRIPRREQRLALDEVGRRHAARRLGCLPWHVGPCAGCGEPINRYGPRPWHACRACRRTIGTATG